LVRFDHKENPQHQTHNADQTDERPSRTSVPHMPESSVPPSNPERHAEYGLDDVEASERDDGLRGVEAYVRALINEKKNDARQPAEYVAQKRRRVLRKT
jgi:hypothetical protein